MTFGRPSIEQRQAQRAVERERNLSSLCQPSRSLHRGVMGGSVHAVEAKAPVKAKPHRSQKLRDSARGEACLVRLPGCPGNPEQTIWSHYRGSAGGKGVSTKAGDVCGAYACTYCDGVYDGQIQRPAGMTKDEVDRLWLEGHIRSLVRAHEKGLV
jgi:hypothetical protein